MLDQSGEKLLNWAVAFDVCILTLDRAIARGGDQSRLFYSSKLEDYVPANHHLRGTRPSQRAVPLELWLCPKNELHPPLTYPSEALPGAAKFVCTHAAKWRTLAPPGEDEQSFE
jgi:hypothetical protein